MEMNLKLPGQVSVRGHNLRAIILQYTGDEIDGPEWRARLKLQVTAVFKERTVDALQTQNTGERQSER